MTDLDPPWIDLFLRQLKSHGLINTAATTAGVSRRTVDRLRENSAEFDYAVEDALEAAADELELEARRRAVEGVDKGVWYQGENVGTETVYSDALLTTLLKAKRADEFAERKQITGAGGAPLANSSATASYTACRTTDSISSRRRGSTERVCSCTTVAIATRRR